jgi:hypothetical protein
MKTISLSLCLVGLFFCGCGNDKSSKSAGENPLSAPADYLGAANKAHKSAVKTLGAVSLDQSIKMFYEQENRYPKSLDELVTSGILPKLPDPPNGMKFEYTPATGQVKVVPKQ